MILTAILAIAISCNSFCQSGTKDLTMNTKTMKQFSLLVRVPVSYSPDQVKAAGIEWDQRITQWKHDGIYVISFAFPGDSYVVRQNEVVNHESVVYENLRAVSVIVLRAENITSACALAKTFPILKFGGNVEVREIPKPLDIAPN